ncbi:MAG: hypothetical protein Q7S40_01700 [Opitutaceae bacterium]|nr:hypothetical protein [Opitutaceae bacterium]
MKTWTIFRLVWISGGVAVLLGLARDQVLYESPLLPREATTTAWGEGGFRANAVHPSTAAGVLPRHIETRGSWLDTDEWQGRAETRWLSTPDGLVRVGVAGYPQHAGCKLWAEFRRADGTISRAECPLENPHEEWKAWDFRPPAGAVALRIIAEDRASDVQGWLAFSQPFAERPPIIVVLYLFAQGFATLALALTLVWGPGLLWAPSGAAPDIRMALWLATGPVILGACGFLIWVLGGMIPPSSLAIGVVAALWIAIGARLSKRNGGELNGPPARALAVSALVVVAVVAKAAYSGGPDGELFGGTIARTLAVGDRSDAGIPFCVVQVAAHHLAPGSPEADRYFTPWTFYSRGPLAGLAALPIVLATGGEPPTFWPEHRWRPFDRMGYAAYRITLMVLASGVIVALFATLALVVGGDWALVGAGLLALSPFGVHEVMFTWPKWPATIGVLASFMLAHGRHAFGAGLALALGFLYHPMALLSAPWIALWAVGRAEKNLTARATAVLQVGIGAGVIVLPWMAIAASAPHLPGSVHAGHGLFLRYWVLADYEPATWETWWSTRWRSFADTFIPFRLYLVDRDHHTLSSVHASSGQLVRFAFSWWNSLPLGLGVGVWALSLIAIARAMRTLSAAVWLLVIGPALMITGYWGAISVGLMRECGHALFVAVIGVTCVAGAWSAGRLGRVLLHPIVPWLQLPETLLMLWLTTFANPHQPSADFADLDWAYFAISVAALVAAAAIIFHARRIPAQMNLGGLTTSLVIARQNVNHRRENLLSSPCARAT